MKEVLKMVRPVNESKLMEVYALQQGDVIVS